MSKLKCRKCDSLMPDHREYCENCWDILLDDLEIAHAELARLQRNFHRATGRNWMPGGGYRLKRRGI